MGLRAAGIVNQRLTAAKRSRESANYGHGRARRPAPCWPYTSSSRTSRPITVAAFCKVFRVTEGFSGSSSRFRAARLVRMRRADGTLVLPGEFIQQRRVGGGVGVAEALASRVSPLEATQWISDAEPRGRA